LDKNNIDQFLKILVAHFLEHFNKVEAQIRKDLGIMKIDQVTMLLQMLKFTARYQVRLPKQMVVLIRANSIFGFLAKELNIDFDMSRTVIKFFQKYPENQFQKIDTDTIPYRRMNREEAIDALNNWLTYLFETDPELYQLVNNYVSKYNI